MGRPLSGPTVRVTRFALDGEVVERDRDGVVGVGRRLLSGPPIAREFERE
jgi:hypothetical protein